MTECASRDCTAVAITAIRSQDKRGEGLVHTIWQCEDMAPKVATRYCGPCGVKLAAALTALTDSDLRVATSVWNERDGQ